MSEVTGDDFVLDVGADAPEETDVHPGSSHDRAADPEPEAVAVAATFEDLYRSEFDPLVRFATLLTGRPEIARDIVQDCFVKLHVKWPSVRTPLFYVRRSVVNGCKSHHRTEKRRGHTQSDLEQPVDLEVDHTLALLADLPYRQRAALVMKFYEGRTEREIADLLGCRPGTVGPLVRRGLDKLREELQ